MDAKYNELSMHLDSQFPFDQKYYDQLVDFYKDYISDVKDLKKFMETIFICDKDNNSNILRIMINNTMRLATLANDIEIIRPGKDALKITYLVTCIETLYKIAGKITDRAGKKLNKTTTVIDFFNSYISDEDKSVILNKVKRSYADDYYEIKEQFDRNISIEIFARIINETRNVFVHEGDYWSISLSHMDCPELKIMNVEEEYREGKQERVYEYELKYEEFHHICVRAFINFIEQYINEVLSRK